MAAFTRIINSAVFKRNRTYLGYCKPSFIIFSQRLKIFRAISVPDGSSLLKWGNACNTKEKLVGVVTTIFAGTCCASQIIENAALDRLA